MPKVMIDGVEYVPVSEANPSAEQIAKGIMEQFWGDLPEDRDWREEAMSLRVDCSDSLLRDADLPTVMDVVGCILSRVRPGN